MKIEQTSKKLYVFANFWPVWKNIYYDQHLKNEKIPQSVKALNNDEYSNQDFRPACKRCFIYVKKNIEEEIPADMVDYFKGYRIVIIEEFLTSLNRLPEIYLVPITALKFLFENLFAAVDYIYTRYIETSSIAVMMRIDRVCFYQSQLLNVNTTDTIDTYAQVSLTCIFLTPSPSIELISNLGVPIGSTLSKYAKSSHFNSQYCQNSSHEFLLLFVKMAFCRTSRQYSKIAITST